MYGRGLFYVAIVDMADICELNPRMVHLELARTWWRWYFASVSHES
jgi:hypothetical protein